MSDRPLPDGSGELARLSEVLWPVIGNDLPEVAHRRLDAAFDLVGEPETWSKETERRMGFLIHVFDGLHAAYYHRDRIESIEREIVDALRASYSEGARGQSASARTPKISHEWIAYLNASRRTLDYAARAVSICFGRSGGSIKVTAKDVAGREPHELSDEVVALTRGVVQRFPHLLTAPGEAKSPRDQAAHRAPVEPVFLFVLFHEGESP